MVGETMVARRALCLLTASSLFVAVNAHADDDRGTSPAAPRTSSLSWIRLPNADACVSTQDLARDVEARLGRAVFVSPSRADVSVEGRIERGPSGFVATITLRDAKGALLGTRELRREGTSCDGMREPLALVVSLMIDPDATLRPVASAPPSSPPPDTARPARPPPPPRATAPLPSPSEPPPSAPPSSSSNERLRFEGGASLAASAGLLPSIALGVGVDALLEPPDFIGLRAFGSVWFDDSVSVPPGAGRATFSLLLAGGGLCPLALRGARAAFHACASGEIGRIASRGASFDVSSPDAASWILAGSIDARLGVRVGGPFTLRAGLAAVVPLSRDRYVARLASGADEEIFRVSPVAGVGELGVGVALP